MSKRHQDDPAALAGDDTKAVVPPEGENAPGTPDESAQDPATQRIEQLEQECAELKDLALRTRADLENYRKRVIRDREDQVRFAEQQLVADLLPVLDDFYRALEATPDSDDGRTIRQGLDLVEKSLRKVLSDHQVTEIETAYLSFDPQFHEAVSQLPRADVAEGTIVATVRRGFLLHDRVIRPAQVVVSRRPHDVD
jgi:molecular chaperone GrpE